MLKVALMVMVVLSIALLLFLFYQSQKLLRQTQKQAVQERRQLKGNYQIHPQLAEEQKKLEQMKKKKADKNQ
ncbi:hypothetical protein [Acinetobacter sp. ANC 4648]|uniref:hypothetical protein n=1 Tax=Acinetobacter sp. ANC 4648 TaxID=1977875 RepID=UPI000A335798|nr:hypothetical protein [Acinetobacter sp. ANC 4648]OTG81741.1 hypothetical protein B9T27_10790 [Acinetobacter sp. ANC 4648]